MGDALGEVQLELDPQPCRVLCQAVLLPLGAPSAGHHPSSALSHELLLKP